MNKVIILQDEYEALLKAQRKLTALEGAGVDNWEWYDDAMAAFHDGEEEYDNN